jgi:hypothetical protein
VVTEQKAPDMVPLDAAARERVEQQVGQDIDSLVSADMQSDEFKSRLDSAFRLGKEEVSNAASLMTGRFMERNMVGMERSPAFKAIHEMRGHLDQLNPGADGDLLAPNRLLGIIPWGNKLQAYFRKYQSAGAQIRDALEKVNLARDDERLHPHIATTGMSALATAQTVARATGNQVQVMEMLQGVRGSIENLVVDTATQLDTHVQKTGEFAANPLICPRRFPTTCCCLPGSPASPGSTAEGMRTRCCSSS